MTRDEFFEKLSDTISAGTKMTEETSLVDLKDWDSMAHVAVLSLFMKTFRFYPDIEVVRDAKTISDLLDIANEKYSVEA